MRILILLLFFAPSLSTAEPARIFGGFGLSIGNQTLGSSGNEESKFISQGYFAEGGIEFSFGGQISAEYGATNTINTLSSQTYMETGSLKFYAAKAGFNFGKYGVGAGYRHNDIKIKSLSTTGPGYLESDYSGYSPLGYMNINFDIGKQVRTTVEGQYVSGKLKSSESSMPQLDFNEMALSLRLYVFFE